MRQSVTTRLMLALVAALSLALVVATQAAPPAQEVGPAQGANFLPARVAFVHAAAINLPTTGSAVTLAVSREGQTRIIRSGLTISETVSYVSLPSGTYTFSLYPGTLDTPPPVGTTPAYSQVITLQGGEDYTVVATGQGASPYPLNLVVLRDTLPAVNPNQGLLRIIHAAPLPGGPPAAVDIINEADSTVLINDLAYGSGTAFTPLVGGIYDVRVDAAAAPGTTLLDPPPLPLAPGTVVTLVAVGNGTTIPASIVALPFTPRGNAEVRVVHAAPFATGDATATPILDPTFGAAANTVFQPLNYGQSTLYKTVAPGIYDARVVAGAAITGTVALTQSLTIEDGQRLTVVVVGTGTPTYPLALETLSDRAQPAGSATADVRIFHAAPFAPTPAGTGVDVVAQNNAPLSPPITNLRYREATSFPGGSQYTTVPSGTPIDLKVVLTGTTDTAIDPPPVTFGPGTVQTIIAVGGANGKAPSVIVLNDLLETRRLWLPAVWQTE
ncbi:MAG TPA: DUF4397 domain-containing protein [Chloroflexaceae bacterium]|nr:DUF4397 domain-containing protein [Chloroflexaceae bacterium]